VSAREFFTFTLQLISTDMNSLKTLSQLLAMAMVVVVLPLAGNLSAAGTDEGETPADGATTVKKSGADWLPGKWRAKMVIDEEKLKKEGSAEVAEAIRGAFPKMTLTIDFKADGTYVVSMEGADPMLVPDQEQKGKWKVLKEDDGKASLELFDTESPQKMELAFDGPDRFTLTTDDLGPLKPPVFRRVKADKKADEPDEKSEKAKE
jgi:hypothetical protein